MLKLLSVVYFVRVTLLCYIKNLSDVLPLDIWIPLFPRHFTHTGHVFAQNYQKDRSGPSCTMHFGAETAAKCLQLHDLPCFQLLLCALTGYEQTNSQAFVRICRFSRFNLPVVLRWFKICSKIFSEKLLKDSYQVILYESPMRK